MSNEPKFVPFSKSSAASSYEKDAKARQAERNAKKAGVPIAQAKDTYKPGQDAPMTAQQIGEAQRNINNAAGAPNEEKPAPGLRPETIQGLKALKFQTEEAKAEVVKTKPTKPAEETQRKLSDEERVEARKQLDRVDDFEFERIMDQVQKDIINNNEERKRVETGLDTIDLAEGLETGEFTQWVPIKPKVLEVQYRSVSPMESEEIRRILFNWAAEDARSAPLQAERYSMMLMVASIVQVNGTKLPSHIDRSTGGEAKFLEAIFLQKYQRFHTYPTPMIHSLSVHSVWFDERVRKLFTAEALKNG